MYYQKRGVDMLAKRMVVPKKGACEMQDFELPEPGLKQLLVRTQVSSMSPGTELAFYCGTHTRLQEQFVPEKSWGSYPFYPGYSACGMVEYAGGDCTLQVGQRVWLFTNHMSAQVVNEKQVIALPDEVSSEDVSFLQQAAISYNGVQRASLVMGDHVVIMGAGLIGMFACQFAAIDGANQIIVIDPDESRRKLALQIGATVALDPMSDNCEESVKQLTGEWGADVVIEASGNIMALQSCFPLARNCGKIVLLGCPHGSFPFSFYDHIQSRSLSVIGAHINSVTHGPVNDVIHRNYRRDHLSIVDMIARKQFDMHSLITHRIKPHDMPAMYKQLADRSIESMGIVVQWS